MPSFRIFFGQGARKTIPKKFGIFLPRRWKSQPIYPVEVAPEFKNYTLEAYNLWQPPEIYGFNKNGTITRDYVPEGSGVLSDASTGYYRKTLNTTVDLDTKPVWMMAAFRANVESANSAWTICSVAKNASAGASIEIGRSNNQLRWSIQPRNGGGTMYFGMGSIVSGTVYNVFGCRTASNTGYMFINNKEYTIAGNDTAGSGSGANEVCIGANYVQSASKYAPYTLFMMAYGNGIIPKQISRELSINPWLLFSSYNSINYFLPVEGAGAPQVYQQPLPLFYGSSF